MDWALLLLKALEKKLVLNGWSKPVKELAQALSWTVPTSPSPRHWSGEEPAGVSSWGACTPAMYHGGGLQVQIPFWEGRRIPFQVKSSPPPALDLRNLPKTNPFGNSVCIIQCPMTMGTSSAQEKISHTWAPLLETCFWGFSPRRNLVLGHQCFLRLAKQL